MPQLSSRLKNSKPSPIVAINTKAGEFKAAGKSIINFSIGVPNFLPPKHVYDAAKEAIDNDAGSYLPPKGTPSLLEAFQYRLKEDGFDYSTNEMCVGVGAKNILTNLFLALLDDDDEVIFPAPYWANYTETVELCGGVCVTPKCAAEQNYKLTPEQLEAAISHKTKVFLFNNPSNPTGMVYSEEEIKALGDILSKYEDIWIISDDIYDKMIFDGQKFHHLLDANPELRDRTAIVQSISKTYGMPGWRVGMVASSEKLIKALASINSNTIMNVNNVAMAAAAAAFSGDHSFVHERRDEFQAKRNLVVKALSAIDGIKCPYPNGAFYAFPNISAFFGKNHKGTIIKNDSHLCELILEEAGVATVPGGAFGDDEALRISYACKPEDLEEGLKRLQQFFAECV